MLSAPKIPDHKAVICMFKDDFANGPNYWKLNVNLLQDNAYTTHIKHVIDQTKKEYSKAWVYRNLKDTAIYFDI